MGTSRVIRLLLVFVPFVMATGQVGFFDEEAAVRALESDGYYVESGSEDVDAGRLAAVVRDSRTDLRPVLLADGSLDAEATANDLLDRLGAGTVVVVSPDEIGVATDLADTGQVDAALDHADAQSSSLTDLPGYLEDFDAALAGEAGAAATGGGGRRLPVGAIVLGVLVMLGGALLVRRISVGRAERARAERALREAREEVGAQVSAVADRIVALHDQVELAGRPELSQLYADATETYAEAQRRLEGSATTSELARVSDDLDRARWQLESITARLEGREPPQEPDDRVACFFDPNHGAGTQQIRLDTAAGGRDVRVCAACAGKLAAGEAPEPRMIEVDGQRIPAAKAPRSYGGGGLGYLDDFLVVLGERRYPYGWGRPYGQRYRPRRRSSWLSAWTWGGGGTWSTTERRGGLWGSGSWSSGARRRGSTSRSRSFSRGSSSRSRSFSRGSSSRSRSRGSTSRRRR